MVGTIYLCSELLAKIYGALGVRAIILYTGHTSLICCRKEVTMKILELPLKKEWYDMIECGEKREEYREVKPYWEKRLLDYKRLMQYFIDNRKELLAKRILFPNRPVIENVCEAFPRGYTHVRFRYGYTKRTMMFTIDSITMGFDGRPEWGAPTDKPVFIIKFQ